MNRCSRFPRRSRSTSCLRGKCSDPCESPMRVNDPEAIAELQELYPKYEAALMANDAETLTRMFWASPHAMRFGVTENLYGIEEIEAFRKGRSPAYLSRTVRRLDIVTFGRDFGSVTLEFERT